MFHDNFYYKNKDNIGNKLSILKIVNT